MLLFEARMSCRIIEPPKHVMLKPMKQTPIIFSTEMVEAVLEGRKTQTRRIVKCNSPEFISIVIALETGSRNNDDLKKEMALAFCPYKQVGDVLWVKETFRLDGNRIRYKAFCQNPKEYKWKSSLFMPKFAARIWLRITNIKIERLNNISYADARAEGIPLPPAGASQEQIDQAYDEIHEFGSLWESINGKDSWSENPWVWVIEFTPIPEPSNIVHL